MSWVYLGVVSPILWPCFEIMWSWVCMPTRIFWDVFMGWMKWVTLSTQTNGDLPAQSDLCGPSPGKEASLRPCLKNTGASHLQGFLVRPTARHSSWDITFFHMITQHQSRGGPWKPSSSPNQQPDRWGFRLLLGKYFTVSAWFSMQASLVLKL